MYWWWQRPRWSSRPDRELFSAKLEIENARVISNSSELYAPVFLNVSKFSRYPCNLFNMLSIEHCVRVFYFCSCIILTYLLTCSYKGLLSIDNWSTFMNLFFRSYELMERKLKVFIYREGAKPIFHQPKMRGIYASEGWFMKLMEGNKRFIVKDPRKAHLFYLPFSSQILRATLPNQKQMEQYLEKYVELIAGKYRFWNRTDGADHFLVACHDWVCF